MTQPAKQSEGTENAVETASLRSAGNGAGRPADDTIALTAFLLGDEWLSADEIQHGLERLGFALPLQAVVARLGRMTREDAPRFEREDRHGFGYYEYRVTHWAETGLTNAFRGFRGRRR